MTMNSYSINNIVHLYGANSHCFVRSGAESSLTVENRKKYHRITTKHSCKMNHYRKILKTANTEMLNMLSKNRLLFPLR